MCVGKKESLGDDGDVTDTYPGEEVVWLVVAREEQVKEDEWAGTLGNIVPNSFPKEC